MSTPARPAARAAATTAIIDLDLPGQDDPEVLDYLEVDGPAGLDIEVEVVLDGEVVARPPYRTMYWSPAQMLATPRP